MPYSMTWRLNLGCAKQHNSSEIGLIQLVFGIAGFMELSALRCYRRNNSVSHETVPVRFSSASSIAETMH